MLNSFALWPGRIQSFACFTATINRLNALQFPLRGKALRRLNDFRACLFSVMICRSRRDRPIERQPFIMGYLYGFFIFAIVYFISAWILTGIAKRQIRATFTGITPRDIEQAMANAGVFKGWVKVNGEGQINQRLGFLRGGRKDRPVMSFAIEPEDDAVVLQIWLSEWIAVWGAIEVAHTVQFLMKRRKAFDAVAALELERTTA